MPHRPRQPLPGIRALVAGFAGVVVLLVLGLSLIGQGLKSVESPSVTTPPPPAQISVLPRPHATHRPAARRSPHRVVAIAERPVSPSSRRRRARSLSRPVPHRSPRRRRPAAAPTPTRSPRPHAPAPPSSVPPPPAASPLPASAPAPITPVATPAVPAAPAPPAVTTPILTLALQRVQVHSASAGQVGTGRMVMTLALSGPSLPAPMTMTLRVDLASVLPDVQQVTSRVDVVGSATAGLALRLRTQEGAQPDAGGPASGAVSNVLEVASPVSQDAAPQRGGPGPSPAGAPAELRLPLALPDGGEEASTALPGPAGASGPPATVAARLDTGPGGAGS